MELLAHNGQDNARLVFSVSVSVNVNGRVRVRVCQSKAVDAACSLEATNTGCR